MVAGQPASAPLRDFRAVARLLVGHFAANTPCGSLPGEQLHGDVTEFTVKCISIAVQMLDERRAPNESDLAELRAKAIEVRDALLEIAHEAMPERDMGLILRSSCAEADAEEIAEDILAMLTLARQVLADATGAPEKLTEGDGPHVLAWRDWVEPAQVETAEGSFEALGVLDLIEGLHSPMVPLKGAGHMYIEPTRALVAVDVNTGGDTSPAAGLKANMAALRDLPRQLRLRGLGGQVVVDLAPMAKKDRRAVETELRRALKADAVETTMVGWTNLGHYELHRARVRMPLPEAS